MPGLLYSVPLIPQQATVYVHLHQRLLDTHRHTAIKNKTRTSFILSFTYHLFILSLSVSSTLIEHLLYTWPWPGCRGDRDETGPLPPRPSQAVGQTNKPSPWNLEKTETERASLRRRRLKGITQLSAGHQGMNRSSLVRQKIDGSQAGQPN